MTELITLRWQGRLGEPSTDVEWTIGGSGADWTLTRAEAGSIWAKLSYLEGWRIRTIPPAQVSIDGVDWVRAFRVPAGSSQLQLRRDGVFDKLDALVRQSGGPAASPSSTPTIKSPSNLSSWTPPSQHPMRSGTDPKDPSSVSDPTGRLPVPSTGKVWLSIGREANCDVRLPGAEIDEVHAKFQILTDGSIEVRDNRSKLGTFVDGVSVSRARIGPGAAIQIGASTLVYDHGTLSVQRSERNRPPVSLRVQDLEARYSGDSAAGLSDVSFTLPQREVYAIIGPSGAGKSTLFAALLGELRNASVNLELNGSRIDGALPFT